MTTKAGSAKTGRKKAASEPNAEAGAVEAMEGEASLIDQIPTLPRVGEIAVETRVMRAETEAPATKTPKANIGWKLKPFVPRVKKQMVTMSDLGMNGQTKGNASPARRKRTE